MKRFLKFLSVFLLLFVLVACDNTSSNDDGNGQKDEDPIVTKYVVSFETFGGTTISSIEVEDGKSLNVLNVDEPVKDGHQFSYWSLTSDGVKVDDELVINKDLKLYAVYDREIYKITIKDELDEVIVVIDVFSNEVPSYEYQLPVKEGYVYEFDGFSLSIDKTDLMNKLPKAIKDETYYIFFSEEAIKYNVEFNTLGGSVVETQTLEHNANLEEPTKPTKEGHKFINWAYDSSGNEVVEFPLQVTKDLTLFAIFEKEVYDVTIKDQDDNVLEVLEVFYNELPNYEYKLPVKEGYVYEFIGFSLSIDKTDLMNKLPKALKDVTYYIFFSEEAIKYNVEFNTLGGSVVETQTLEHNANLEEPTKPTKEGHKFINWAYDSNGNEVAEFPLQVTKDLTLYAIFEKEVYDLTIKDQDDNILEILSILYNELPDYQYELPVLYGYTYEFLGYSLNKDGSNLLNTLPKAVKHETYYLIIKEERVNFTVSFDSLGGSAVANQTIPYNDYLNEPTKPTKEGYVFVSWVYDTTTNEKVVFPLQVTKNIKLYGTWNEELEIKEYLSALLDGFKLNPYSYIPETLRKDNNVVAYNENDFNNFLNVNNINYGFGEQWNMVLNNLDQSEVFFNVLGVVDSLASTSVALFNNYLDSNPADSNNFEFKESIYSVAINYSNDILSYNLSYDANIPIIGNVKAEINIAHNVITLEKEVRISLGGANALKYEIAENSYSFAIKYLGVRRALFAIEKDLNGEVEGHIYEFLELSGVGTKSFAQFYITDEYLSVVGNKADAMLLFDGVINELYDVASAKLLGYEVRETLSAITYNTLWFNLTDISNINNIRYEETEEEKLFYVNNSLASFQSKNVGGLNLKRFSRRYDISFRKQYLYTMEDNKIVEKEVLVPMLFIQQEQLDNFPQDIIEKNSYLSNVQVTLPEKDLNKIILDYETLLIIFDENKENITSEDIINYIG